MDHPMSKIAARSYRGYHRRRSSLVLSFCSSFLDYLGTDLSRELKDDLMSGRLERVVDREIDPRAYCSSSEFRRDYLAVSLLSKFPFKEYRSEADRKAVALEKFFLAEEGCKQAALRLRNERTVLPSGITAAAYLHTMQREIRSVLGEFSWNAVEAFMAFGPGATTRLPRRKADAYYKLGGIPHVTQRCADLATVAVSRVPLWNYEINRLTGHPLHPISFEWVSGNRITTVPKNAKTERTIAIEPDLNLMFQKGIGGVIRKRLAVRAGIDLNSQVPNQVLARQGSISGKLATIDLSSASDSISMELVARVLPPSWVQAIEHCRSPKGTLPDGSQVLYRKVSSMGNGFTFELESLLFWAAAKAVMKLHPCSDSASPPSVYGDDIVVPVQHAQLLIEFLAFIGFETNRGKTFIEGPFRESCGKHYFHGDDVTPFYIREEVDNVPRMIWLHNQVVRWFIRDQGSAPAYLGGEELAILDGITKHLPKEFSNTAIPYGEPGSADDFGDIGLLKPFCEARPRQEWFGSYRARGFASTSKYYRPDDDGFLLRQLYSCNRMSQSGWEVWGHGIPTVERVRAVKPLTFQWRDPYALIG